MTADNGGNNIAVLGLGLMGSRFAGHFLAAGRAVSGFDPDPDRRQDLDELGGRSAATVAEAVVDSGLVLLSLPNGEVMRGVSAEIAAAGVPSLLVVDTTTSAPDEVEAAAAVLAEAGHRYVDATVSGNAAQLSEKDVIYMIGGDEADVAVATELLSPIGRQVYSVGPVGAGARAKLVVNHVLSINRTGVAEGLGVAEKAGLDLESMLQILRDSAAYSKAMDIWGDRMVRADHHPPASRVKQSHKDSRLINAHAEELGASHELVAVVRQALAEAEETGLADADNSAIIELMRRRAGIGRLSQ